MSNWQQILALDARYNACRAPNNPSFRTLYIRRRSQLLRENWKEKGVGGDSMSSKNYLRIRSQLLAERYGLVPSEGSIRSRSQSVRSTSQLTLENDNFADLRISSMPSMIVPTSEAEASRALVGDTSLAENYSFAGVHHIFEQHHDLITRIKFAHDDVQRVGVASMDSTLSICQLSETSGDSRVLLTLQGHRMGITDFEWSLSNDLLVTCSLDCTVCVWEPNSGECVRVVVGNAPFMCCAFQPLNNNLVVTGNNKGAVQVLNISTGMHVKMSASKVAGSCVSMAADSCSGRLLWVGDDRGSVCSFIIDINSGKLIKGRRIVVADGFVISSLAVRAWVSREARDPLMLINTTANALYVYRICGPDGALVRKRTFPVYQTRFRIRSNFCPLMSFRLGVCVLTGSEDCSVQLLDIEHDSSKACVNKLQGHSDPVLDVCFNRDESFLASGDAKGVVIIWKRSKRHK